MSQHFYLSTIYFFWQATGERINTAVAVLRGLIYMLVHRQRSLVAHIRKKYDHAGQELFHNVNTWFALSEILTNILHDPALKKTYLIIDALDEYLIDLPKLLGFIVQSSTSTRVKWLLSSRKDSHIEQKLRPDNLRAQLSLDLKENAKQVSRAVETYIDRELFNITSLQKNRRHEIRDMLR